MIKFVDNWLRPVQLTLSQDTVALDLEDGIYVLTVADSETAATRWEILTAEVVAGEAGLMRQAPQAWGAGSVIYCAANSFVMNAIFAEIVDSATRIGELEGIATGPLTIIEELPSTGDLPASGAGGDAYLIGGHVYVWATGTGEWVDAGSFEGEPGAPGAPGDDGRAAEFRASATHVQWRLVGDPTWIDLLPLSELAGADGADGADGRNPEFQSSATHLQYRLTGDTEWVDLLPLSSLQGPAGDDGADGREIELQTSATHIQYRYTGDATWTDLIALSALKGDQGDAGADGADGVPAEFQASATHIQWRLVGDATWVDLVPLSEIAVVSGGAVQCVDKAHVYRSTAGNSHSTGWAKVALDTVLFDTNSIWDAANTRFIPKKAGYYQVNMRVRRNMSTTMVAGVGKNGSLLKVLGPDAGSMFGSGGSVLVYCNGTTDYLEPFLYSTSAIAYTTGQVDTWMDVTGPV